MLNILFTTGTGTEIPQIEHTQTPPIPLSSTTRGEYDTHDERALTLDNVGQPRDRGQQQQQQE